MAACFGFQVGLGALLKCDSLCSTEHGGWRGKLAGLLLPSSTPRTSLVGPAGEEWEAGMGLGVLGFGMPVSFFFLDLLALCRVEPGGRDHPRDWRPLAHPAHQGD